MISRLQKKLKQQAEKQLTRNLSTERLALEFNSNDYLGISKSDEVKLAFIKAIEEYGIGSCAAQTIGGFSKEHAQLVAKLCEFTGSEDACLFSSGFMANIAMLTTLTSKSENIYLDRNSHASLIIGAKLSNAKLVRYKHLDLKDLKQKICAPGLIVTDTVFSMSGITAPIQKLYDMTSPTLNLALDDAHGIGVIGNKGLGVFNAFPIPKNTTCTITFGKSLGTSGAAITGSKIVVEAIRQFSSEFLFTTAMPPGIAAATRKALELIETDTWRFEKLHANIDYFRSKASTIGLSFSDSKTAIQYIYCDDLAKTIILTEKIADLGIRVQAIRPPTVAKKDIGIRIVLSAKHEYSDIDKLLLGLKNATT